MFLDSTEHKDEADLERLGNMLEVTEYIDSNAAPYLPLLSTLCSFISLLCSTSEENIVLVALLNLLTRWRVSDPEVGTNSCSYNHKMIL